MDAASLVWAGLNSIAVGDFAVGECPCDRREGADVPVDLELSGGVVVNCCRAQAVLAGAVDLFVEELPIGNYSGLIARCVGVRHGPRAVW